MTHLVDFLAQGADESEQRANEASGVTLRSLNAVLSGRKGRASAPTRSVEPNSPKAMRRPPPEHFSLAGPAVNLNPRAPS